MAANFYITINSIDIPFKDLDEKTKESVLQNIRYYNSSMMKRTRFIDSQECCICLFEKNNFVFFNCKAKHEFCKDCLTEWLKKRNTCPLCRENKT
jgi:hypothetical protein